MQQRTVSKLHIAVRTDGSDDRAAYDLSLQRARAVRAFLVDYGIAASRLSIAAYGNADYKKGIARNEVEVKFF
jgi:outer membrane protein OmpA-like peptidoglycan-associated protein